MTGIKRSSKQILPMVIGSTLVLGLIWLNTFIHQNSFSDRYLDLLRILSRCNFQHRQSILLLFHYLPPQI